MRPRSAARDQVKFGRESQMEWLVIVGYVAVALISGWWVLIALPVVIAAGAVLWACGSARLGIDEPG